MKNKFDISFVEKLRKIRAAGVETLPLGERYYDDDFRPLDERVKDLLGIVNNHNIKSTEVIYFIMYDIEDNKIRTQISKYLIRKGCSRIQKSIFIARNDRKTYNEISSTLKEIQEMYDNRDSIIIVPVSTDEMRAMKIIGENIDFDLVLDKKNVLFF